MKSLKLSLFLCWATLGVASASPLTGPFFDGQVNYQISGDFRKVTLTHTKISNDSNERTTGTIKVSLWAMDDPYEGGPLKGYRLASYKLDGLKPGFWWKQNSRTLDATMPEWPDYYFMLMTVEEYHADGYRLTDWIDFENTAYLDRPAPKAPPPPAKPLLSMEGPYRWQTYPAEGKLEVSTGKISHTRNGKTGSLRIAVWATSTRYAGGRIQGWILGQVRKQALEKARMYPEIGAVVDYKPPPSGRYFVTITLSEYDGSQYVIRDSFTFDESFRF